MSLATLRSRYVQADGQARRAERVTGLVLNMIAEYPEIESWTEALARRLERWAAGERKRADRADAAVRRFLRKHPEQLGSA